MKRFFVLCAAALVGTLVATGCGSASSPAAVTINGVDLPRSTFEGDLRAYLGSDQYVAAAGQRFTDSSGNPIPLTGNIAGSASQEFASQVLGTNILFEVNHQEVVRKGLTIDPSVSAEAAQIAEQANGGAEAWGTLPQDLRDRFTKGVEELYQLRLSTIDIASLDDSALQKVYDEDPTAFAQTCASHILVATEDEAKAALAEIEAGTSFADEAKKVSTDTGSKDSGGELRAQDGSCFTGGQWRQSFDATFVDALFKATPNEVFGPVQTQFGYHLILVTEQKPVAFADAKPEVKTEILRRSADPYEKLRSDLYKKASITLDPRYGTWNTETQNIDPPAGSKPAPTTTAGEPSGSSVPDPGATDTTTAG